MCLIWGSITVIIGKVKEVVCNGYDFGYRFGLAKDVVVFKLEDGLAAKSPINIVRVRWAKVIKRCRDNGDIVGSS